MQTFDPSEYVKHLQQLLVSDKKKIGFLFGAGTSMVVNPQCKKSYIPGIGEMTSQIMESIKETYPDYFTAIKNIKEELLADENIKIFTIEILLSQLELKRQVVGKGILNGLNKGQISDLIKVLKKEIKKIVGIHEKIEPKDLIHSKFAEWIKKADRKSAIEIFTTNYDYLFELGLEYNNIPYYDGFTGSYQPFFDGESVNNMGFMPAITKLWKIHGSLGWHYCEKTKKIIRKESDNDDILIYPSTLKYDQSRKQPYTALGDRLTDFIKQPDTVLIVCGYSFGDEHINERIISALASNALGHVYVLLFDKNGCQYTLTETSSVAEIAIKNSKISIWGMRNAVIGGVYGTWQLKREPDKDSSISMDLYYEEDAHSSVKDELRTEIIQEWKGTGCCYLSDFSKFVNFLQSMIFEV